jgi:acyl-CoA reductase-like NAD-dependent aldehyde dehydrogenase
LSNSGQTCLGVERVYVHEQVYDEFIDKTITLAARVHAGPGAEDKIGPITMPSQVAVIRRHIVDAVSRGGRVVLGGLGSISGQYVQPTIMVDVPEDSLAVTEETFGPTMTITKVASMDEAVELVNASPYALGASVFGKDGVAVADRLRSGGASVNSYVMYAAVPNLPLGGVGASGFGRVHGPDGLKEFTYARSMTRQRFRSPLPLTTFRRTARIDWLVKVLIRALHGRH